MKVRFKSYIDRFEFSKLLDANVHIAEFLGTNWWNASQCNSGTIDIVDEKGEKIHHAGWDVVIHPSEVKYFEIDKSEN